MLNKVQKALQQQTYVERKFDSTIKSGERKLAAFYCCVYYFNSKHNPRCILFIYMLFVSILHHYLLWHYTRAFGEILHVWKNFVWFTFHFFSIPQLLKSFLSPWKRMTEERGQTFNFEDLASFIIINLISRIVGVLLRTVLIIAGLGSLFILTVGIVATYIFWILTPLMIAVCIYYGVMLIVS